MRLYITPLFFALALPAAALAQITQVSGTVTDPNNIPYANGQIKMQLVTTAGSPVTGQPTVTNNNQAQCVSSGLGSAPCQMPFQGTVGPLALTSAGSFNTSLQDNTQVTPTGTQWLFSVTISPGENPPLGFGPQSCSAQITISGASQSVSAAISAACPVLSRIGTVTGIGGGGGVLTNFSYAQTGMDQLDLGSVTNPTTTPQLTLAAQSVQPGYVLAGPIPPAGGVNPSFESSAVASLPSSNAPTITATPATASSAALLVFGCGDGSHPAAPSGWTVLDNSGSLGNDTLYSINLSSGSRLTAASTCTSSTTWLASLGFFGGTVSSVAHSSTLSTSCGNGCTTGSLTTGSGDLILVIGTWSSASNNLGLNPTVSDNAGNNYSMMTTVFQTSGGGGIGTVVFFAQFVAAGSATITINANENTLNWGAVRAYDITGLTSYYSGPMGPWAFRRLTQSDISSTPLLWANLLPGTNTSSGTFAQSGGTMDFSGSASEKIPVAAGAAPTADGAVASNSTTHGFNFGSNGTTLNVAVASTGAGGSGTTCTAGTFVSAISNTAAPTCTTPTQAGTQLSFNQHALASNVSVSASTITTVDSITLSALPAACATNGCRLRVSYSYYASGGLDGMSWATDGTTQWAQATCGLPTNNFSQCEASQLSPSQYSSGATPTITIQVIDAGAITMCTGWTGTAPCNTGSFSGSPNNPPNIPSRMFVEVITSN